MGLSFELVIGPRGSTSYLHVCVIVISEYASVGYMAKRIQMRKNRFLALQKMAEQKKNEAMMAAANAARQVEVGLADGGIDHHGLPKQTVRRKL